AGALVNGFSSFVDGLTNSVGFANIEQFDVTGTAQADNFTTGAGADTLRGGAGNDTLDGVSGADSIAGGAGMDELRHADFSGAAAGLTINNSGASLIGGG